MLQKWSVSLFENLQILQNFIILQPLWSSVPDLLSRKLFFSGGFEKLELTHWFKTDPEYEDYVLFQENKKRWEPGGGNVTLELWCTMKSIKISKWTHIVSHYVPLRVESWGNKTREWVRRRGARREWKKRGRGMKDHVKMDFIWWDFSIYKYFGFYCHPVILSSFGHFLYSYSYSK
jgi:hypothetical protein